MEKKITWTMPVGVDSFRELRLGNKFYVDKTAFIAEFLRYDEKVTLITRPRRFGKTLNMSMMREFFDMTRDSREIFSGLEIMDTEYAAQMNSRPTLYFTFKNVTGSDFEGLKESLAYGIKSVFYYYERILERTVDWESSEYYEFKKTTSAFRLLDVEVEKGKRYVIPDNIVKRSLTVLISTLATFYQKPILLLIDEYDQPLIEAHVNRCREEFSNKIYGTFLGDALKGNENLGQSLLTGIQRLAKESIFSKLNNVAVYTVAKKRYAGFFGMTEFETKEALEENGLNYTPAVKKFYDGYRIGELDIYNPWSLVNYISIGELAPYWINTSTNLLIRELIFSGEFDFKEDFEELIEYGQVTVAMNLDASFFELKSSSTLWGLLVNAGYLTIVSRKGLTMYTIRIPNEEVKSEFRNIVSLYIKTRDDGLATLFDALSENDMPAFLKLYRRLIMRHVSFYDTIDENSFHMFFLGMCIATSGMYEVKSNREIGHGRSDVAMKSLFPDVRPHVVIEFKTGEDVVKGAGDALAQIEEKAYFAEFEGDVLCIGIGHDKKKCELVSNLICVGE